MCGVRRTSYQAPKQYLVNALRSPRPATDPCAFPFFCLSLLFPFLFLSLSSVDRATEVCRAPNPGLLWAWLSFPSFPSADAGVGPSPSISFLVVLFVFQLCDPDHLVSFLSLSLLHVVRRNYSTLPSPALRLGTEVAERESTQRHGRIKRQATHPPPPPLSRCWRPTRMWKAEGRRRRRLQACNASMQGNAKETQQRCKATLLYGLPGEETHRP